MNELSYWVWLSQAFSYGSEQPRKLLEHFASPKDIYEAEEDTLRHLNILNEEQLNALRHTSLSRAEEILADCTRKNIQVIAFHSDAYPARLRNIFGAPMVLYVLGKLGDIDHEPVLAVVGTRTASSYGAYATETLCRQLAEAGLTIVSGCAVGIDAAAHGGALQAGGRTIGVLGCGLDINYPAENRDLKRRILKDGALISEFPPGTRPSGQLFPVRNRIISALSLGVLVTEAPQKSGALITAEHAIEQGKDVFCLPPHDIFDARYTGVAKYLRDGAIPVFSAQDVLFEYLSDYPHKLDSDAILEAFRTQKAPSQPKAKRAYQQAQRFQPKDEKVPTDQPAVTELEWDETFGEDYKKIFHLLTDAPQMIDDLVTKSELPMYLVLSALTELEIAGYVTSLAGNRYQRAANVRLKESQ